MNMNMLINMFTKLVARRAMNWGINKGMDTLSRKNQPPTGAPDQTAPAGGKGQRQDKQTRDLARKMRTLSRMTRR